MHPQTLRLLFGFVAVTDSVSHFRPLIPHRMLALASESITFLIILRCCDILSRYKLWRFLSCLWRGLMAFAIGSRRCPFSASSVALRRIRAPFSSPWTRVSPPWTLNIRPSTARLVQLKRAQVVHANLWQELRSRGFCSRKVGDLYIFKFCALLSLNNWRSKQILAPLKPCSQVEMFFFLPFALCNMFAIANR